MGFSEHGKVGRSKMADVKMWSTIHDDRESSAYVRVRHARMYTLGAVSYNIHKSQSSVSRVV